MNSHIIIYSDVEILYYNCVECNKPLMTLEMRRRGTCGCLEGKSAKAQAERFADVCDPYGQIILDDSSVAIETAAVEA